MKYNRRIKRLIMITSAVIASVGIIIGGYLLWEKAPSVSRKAEPAPDPDISQISVSAAVTPMPEAEPEPKAIAFDNVRKDGIYTVLLVGNDDGTGNTDTIMLGKIDTVKHRMDFISIPRDTYINEAWEMRKLNGVYWTARYAGASGIEALEHQIKRLTGFAPDCYAVVDLQAFVDAVDAVGGIYFDVPAQMDYEDSTQELYIHLSPGYQLLDGYQCMGLCRFREGYFNGDLDRISVQHDFLSTALKQVISLGKIPDITKVISILSENTDTNLTPENIAFFMRQALKCDCNDITFSTAPCTTDVINGYSYAFLKPQPWMEMLNALINPYEQQIGYENIDIVYESGSGYSSTGRFRGESYFSKPEAPSAPSVQTTPVPEAAPTPTPLPSPTIISVPTVTAVPDKAAEDTAIPMEDVLIPGRKISY